MGYSVLYPHWMLREPAIRINKSNASTWTCAIEISVLQYTDVYWIQQLSKSGLTRRRLANGESPDTETNGRPDV